MKLQIRFFLLVLAVFISFIGLLALQRNFDAERSQRIMQSELHDRKKLFAMNIDSEGASLRSLSEDYSFWDDMVQFVQTGDRQFAKTNLDSGLETFKADADWVYRPNGTLVYSSARTQDFSFKEVAFPTNLFDQLKQDKFAHFYMQLPKGIFEVRAATIVPGTDADHQTPDKGFWIVGRYLQQDYLKQLGAISQSNVQFRPGSTSPEDMTYDDTVIIQTPLNDLNGKPVQVLRATSKVALIGQLDMLYKQELAMLGGIGFITTIVILAMLWLLVLRPINTISTAIRLQKPEQLDRLTRSSSQFGGLAKIVQQFFGQKTVIEQDAFKKAELERLNKEKASFLAVAAHELKAPGSIIQLVSEDLPHALERGASLDDIKKQLDIITHQSHKMTSLISDLRSASEGKAEPSLQYAAFSFDDFIRKEAAELGYVINQKIQISGSSNQRVNTDEGRLSQIVSNLIRNAAKYSPSADTIDIRVSYADGNVSVAVQDYGIGIAPEDKAHIFDKYYRASNAKDGFQGLGLGLSISKTAIDRLGGTLRVESELGKGTTMYLELPAFGTI